MTEIVALMKSGSSNLDAELDFLEEAIKPVIIDLLRYTKDKSSRAKLTIQSNKSVRDDKFIIKIEKSSLLHVTPKKGKVEYGYRIAIRKADMTRRTEIVLEAIRQEIRSRIACSGNHSFEIIFTKAGVTGIIHSHHICTTSCIFEY